MTAAIKPPPAPHSPESMGPHPRRFRWLKRITAIVILMAMMLAALDGWWAHVATRRIRELVDAAHARGEPILPDDFNPAPLPDSRNAAILFQQAAGSIIINSAYTSLDQSDGGVPLSPVEVTQAGQVMQANAKVLVLVRQARARPQADWGIQLRSPAFATLLPYLNGQRGLANMLRWCAQHEHATGNDAEAVEIARDLLRLARAVDDQPPFLVTHLVAIGIHAVACNTVEQMAPDLVIDPGESGRGPLRSATRAQVRALIDGLLDDAPLMRGSVRSWYGERMGVLDAAGYPGALGGGVADVPPLRPMFKLDAVRMAQRTSQVAVAAAQPDWPDAMAKLPGSINRGPEAALDMFTHLFGNSALPAPGRAMQHHYKALTQRHAVAVLLALRLYQFDHAGRLPAALGALVPQYLPLVPADAMAAGAPPLRYKPDRAAPVVYSVGFNGIDDGGASLPSPGIDRWTLSDAVWAVGPASATTRPSTTAQDQQ